MNSRKYLYKLNKLIEANDIYLLHSLSSFMHSSNKFGFQDDNYNAM